MNKYQEALKVLYENIDCSNNFYLDNLISENLEIISELVDKYQEIQNVYFKKEPMESADLNGEKLQELYNFINKLLDKATLKKRIYVEPTLAISSHYICPICKTKVSPICCYCETCGQKLE